MHGYMDQGVIQLSIQNEKLCYKWGLNPDLVQIWWCG